MERKADLGQSFGMQGRKKREISSLSCYEETHTVQVSSEEDDSPELDFRG